MTSPTLLCALALSPVLGDPVYTFTPSARAELRFREPGDPDTSGSGQLRPSSLDADLIANLGLGVRWPRLRMTLVYTPRLTETDLAHGGLSDVLHSLAYVSSWTATRRLQLQLSARGAIGTRRTIGLGVPQTDPVTGAPIIQTVSGDVSVRYAAIDVGAGATLRTSHTTSLGLSGGYSISGSTDEAQRIYAPFVHAARARLDFTQNVSPVDALVTVLSGADARSDLGAGVKTRVRQLNFEQHWRSSWAVRTQSDLAVGAALSQDTTIDRAFHLYPLALATLNHRLSLGQEHSTIQLTGTLRSTVEFDPISGQSDPRGQALARIGWARNLHYGVYLAGSFTNSFIPNRQSTITLQTAELGTHWQMLKRLALDFGMREFYQKTHYAVAVPNGLQWGLFVALVYVPRPIDF